MNVLRTHSTLQIAVGVGLLVLVAVLGVVAPLGALFATFFGVIYLIAAFTAHLHPIEHASEALHAEPDAGTSSMGIL